jgi:nicotinamide mononucleotide transporter
VPLDFYLEWTGSIAGLFCVILTVRRHILCWPVGLLSVVAFGILFFRVKLYADMGLQIFYVGTGLYGWWAWLYAGPDGNPLPMSRLAIPFRVLLPPLIVAMALAVGFFLDRYTDAALPYWDSLATVLSLAAQILLMRKIWETWLLWIAVDILSIGIYLAKNLPVTAILYGIFLVLAITGAIAWWREMRVISNK